MALSASLIWEVRSTGSDSNGGAFKSGASGTDYSQQTSAQKSGADLAIHASDSTKVQPVAAGVAAADVGNVIQITAGTGFTTGFYEITAQDGTYWTLDRSAGTTGSTSGTYAMGGCLATISAALTTSAAVAGNTVYVKATATYNEGVLATGNGGSYSSPMYLIGYSTTRGDNGYVTIDGQNTRTYCLRISQAYMRVSNFIFTGATNTLVDYYGASNSLRLSFSNCKLLKGSSSTRPIGFGSTTFTSVDFEIIENCYLESLSYSFYSVFGRVFNCVFNDCDNMQLGSYSGHIQISRCIFINGTQSGTPYAIRSSDNNVDIVIEYCTFYNFSVHAIYFANTNNNSRIIIENNIFSEVTGYGVYCESAQYAMRLRNNAFHNCSSGYHYNTPLATGDIVLSTSPFTNAASNDFTLNNTAGGGAAVRAAALPTSTPSALGLTNYLDGGALQHQDAGSSGISNRIIQATNIGTY